MNKLQTIVEEIFTPEELTLIDSGNYMPGRAVLDAKIELAIAAEREACAKVCEQNEVDGNIAMFGTHYARACGDCAIAIRKRSII